MKKWFFLVYTSVTSISLLHCSKKRLEDIIHCIQLLTLHLFPKLIFIRILFPKDISFSQEYLQINEHCVARCSDIKIVILFKFFAVTFFFVRIDHYFGNFYWNIPLDYKNLHSIHTTLTFYQIFLILCWLSNSQYLKISLNWTLYSNHIYSSASSLISLSLIILVSVN